MSAPDPGWADDVELDVLLLSVQTGVLEVLNANADLAAGLAAIRAQHERGTASRPPPARASPAPQLPQDALPD